MNQQKGFLPIIIAVVIALVGGISATYLVMKPEAPIEPIVEEKATTTISITESVATTSDESDTPVEPATKTVVPASTPAYVAPVPVYIPPQPEYVPPPVPTKAPNRWKTKYIAELNTLIAIYETFHFALENDTQEIQGVLIKLRSFSSSLNPLVLEAVEKTIEYANAVQSTIYTATASVSATKSDWEFVLSEIKNDEYIPTLDDLDSIRDRRDSARNTMNSTLSKFDEDKKLIKIDPYWY